MRRLSFHHSGLPLVPFRTAPPLQQQLVTLPLLAADCRSGSQRRRSPTQQLAVTRRLADPQQQKTVRLAGYSGRLPGW